MDFQGPKKLLILQEINMKKIVVKIPNKPECIYYMSI